jgi:anti-sigma factor RsiW
VTSPCEQLDVFFDGELSPEAAGEFRDHLASCKRCQDALHGHMQEALVVDDAAPIKARPARRVRIAYVGIATALAASVAIAWWVHGAKPTTHMTDPLAVAISIERGSATMRGQSAHVGDTLHVRGAGAIWIYRGDHELVCSASRSCDVPLRAIGTYSIVTFVGGTLPEPHGDLDTDVGAAVTAGARDQIQTVDVQ